MPDLPTPKDAAEAALFSECWDTVLSYADLCAASPEAAHRLATEAFTEGIREARAAPDGTGPARGAGRRAARLPRIPQLLTAVRTTAAAWEEQGRGQLLAPELRLWLTSEHAARHTGPPLGRPLALRTLRDMQPADAELLWLAEVEALPLTVVARRLRLDPAAVGAELAEARALFRDRCLRNHLDTQLPVRCRGYARMLDALTRGPGAAEIPDDLSHHLARCVRCSEAAACLRPHGGGLPAALAGGVIGWGGLAYLERRRRAADVRLGAAHPAPADPEPPRDGAHRTRVLRNGLLVAAVLVSALALAVSLMPGGGSTDDATADPGDGRPVADPRPSLPSKVPPPTSSAPPDREPIPTSTKPTRPTPPPTRTASAPAPEPQGTASSAPTTTPAAHPGPGSGATTSCVVDYDLANQWPDGFQATVKVTTAHALDGWQLTWTFRDGQRVGQMWDAGFTQTGAHVTATAAPYNRTVAADATLTLGFLASWHGRNSPAYDFELNGRTCVTA
ncbi:cellulose binding domain-containing protein [Streptomyces broussonetiae]|uniref:Cellulose binding domain-containing protein n=1 Tax=Streptomyces broussonetiae TaxID=2686304 RepID=A0ABV5E4R4_9ACTN